MASWIKDPENGYLQIAQVRRAWVSNDPEWGQGNNWFILVDSGARFIAKTGFASQAAAQTALDNAIVNLGGSI